MGADERRDVGAGVLEDDVDEEKNSKAKGVKGIRELMRLSMTRIRVRGRKN